MKLKQASLITLVQPALGVAIAIGLVACSGQSPQVIIESPPPGMAPPGGAPPKGGMPGFDGITLTAEQQTQLQKSHAEMLAGMAKILTTEQKTQFENTMKQGQPPPEALRVLNLPADKLAEAKKLMEAERQKVTGILTAEQNQQLQKNRPSPPPGGGI
ncbi:MAG: Spy/CpxP family protein refolding chaperone [Aphanocapsa sp. GSE-SYN-MK-11-07L]|jgi:Spy/CpxP family protein refolding chaperone|nr:Spy/CpxP family protein refolding chaperone [Aphanocapsa sp. GSE-SYN-MK-11-07L]